jgi:hypothetical protein
MPGRYTDGILSKRVMNNGCSRVCYQLSRRFVFISRVDFKKLADCSESGFPEMVVNSKFSLLRAMAVASRWRSLSGLCSLIIM